MAEVLINHIKGQGWILNKLKEACKRKHLPHALLFTGPDGVGRKKSAYALSQLLLCGNPDNPPCGSCLSCVKVASQKSEHIFFIEPETLHIKAESVRAVLKFVCLQSFAPARVIIIDGAHQMNTQACACLLKVLEEPPQNVYFILISSHPSSLPVTIRSRMQAFRFSPLGKEDMPKGVEEWMIQACQGRRDQLQFLEEHKDLRKKSFELLKNVICQKELPPVKNLSDLLQDRKKSLFVCLCWQQIFRDGRWSQIRNNNFIHADFSDLIELLKSFPESVLDSWFLKTLQMEQDLKSYLDYKMLFDNLCREISHQSL